jgi:hypothetical protein
VTDGRFVSGFEVDADHQSSARASL